MENGRIDSDGRNDMIRRNDIVWAKPFEDLPAQLYSVNASVNVVDSFGCKIQVLVYHKFENLNTPNYWWVEEENVVEATDEESFLFRLETE